MNRRTIIYSFVAVCAICATVIGVFAIIFPTPAASALWWLALLLAFIVGGYQRRTGPGYDIPARLAADEGTVAAKLPTSFAEESDCPVRLKGSLEDHTAELVYRRYPTEDPWTRVPFSADGEDLVARIPHQPPAGKVEYHIELHSSGERRMLPKRDNVIVRFRGDVSNVMLLPHVLLVMTGMIYSMRTGFETLYAGPNQDSYALVTTATLIGGAMVFGPLVQKAAFGAYWTGFPLGTDLTDTKMLVAVTSWVVASAASLASLGVAPALRVAAAVITLFAFLIPHSLFGSELDYAEQD